MQVEDPRPGLERKFFDQAPDKFSGRFSRQRRRPPRRRLELLAGRNAGRQVEADQRGQGLEGAAAVHLGCHRRRWADFRKRADAQTDREHRNSVERNSGVRSEQVVGSGKI